MNTDIAFISMVIIAGAFVTAAWPLLFLKRVRAVMLGVGGSGCIGLGSTTMAMLAGGMLQLPASTALAEQATPVPAEAKTPAAEADPVIDTPRDTVEIPPGRPKWVGSEPKLTGNVHTVSVASGPYATDAQARRALDEALVKAVNEYVAERLESELAPQLIRVDLRKIKKDLIKQENTYHDVARYSDPVGWMHENFALLEFDKRFRDEMDRRWEKVRASSRLAQTGLVSGAVLLLLGSVFGYFRMDNATRGYYTGRLQFMTAAAILAVVVAGAVVGNWIHWL